MDSTDIIGATVVITGLSAIRHLHDNTFQMALVFHGFLLGGALMLVGLASPAIARMLALMGVLGSVMLNGPVVFKALGAIK